MYSVVEVDAVVPGGSPTVVSLRFTTAKAYRHSKKTYIPAIQQELVFEQNLFNRGAVSGDVSIGYGDIVVSNADGRFDDYRFYGFDGQNIRVYNLNELEEPLSNDNLYFTGTVKFAEFTYDSIVFSISDRQEVLNVAHQTSTFLGTNQGPNGFEGLPDDIQGQIKPMLFGYCHNISPYPVNRARLIYGINYDRNGNRAPIQAVWDVRDKGGELFFFEDYLTASALVGATVASGRYSTCLAEGLIKLGSVPQGDVTCTAQNQLWLGSSAPRVVYQALTQAGLVPGTDFDEAQLEALVSKNACMVGYYLTDDTTTFDIVTSVLSSIGAWISPDRLGVFRFGRFDLPSNDSRASVFTFTSSMIEGSLKRLPSGDENKGIPVKKLELKHSKRWKRLSKSEMLPSVVEEDRYFLDQDYSSAVSENQDVAVTHKLSQYITRETYLVTPRNLKLRNADFSRTVLTDDYDTVSVPSGASAVISNGQLTLTPSVNGAVTVRQVVGGYASTFNVLTKYEEVYGDIPLVFGFTVVSGTCSVLFRRGASAVVTIANYTPGAYELQCSASFNNSASFGFSFQFANIDTVTVTTVGNLYFKVQQQGLTPNEEADRLRTILSSDLERFVFKAPFSLSKDVYLGDKVTLVDDRFNLAEGRDFIVVGKDEDLDSRAVIFDVVGESQ